MTTQPLAVIVDGYSTGNFLPAAFAKAGVSVLHVRSSAEPMASMLAPNLAEYVDELVCAGPEDVGTTVAALAELKPVAVLAGQEPGVPLADLLSERLGLASNGSALSTARRDKYEMIEALRAKGIRCADQLRTTSPAEAVAWARERGEYPVVVKPLSSASSDGVSVCRDEAEVERAAQEVLGTVDIFDHRNTEVLVQSYLDGTEYIVDTVSANGEHYLCGVWQYDKTTTATGKRIYDRDVLLDSGEHPVPELMAYLETVLAALGIEHGPAHAEVMMTAQGPALVEIGARLNGNMTPGFHDVCLPANQADLIVLAYTDPQKFVATYGNRRYDRVQPAVVHNTSTDQDGVVTGVDQEAVDAIAALPGVHLVSVKLGPGKRIRPTTDLLSSPLRIFLTAPDAADLAAAYDAIQELKDRVYLT
ncbi:ATP-grasp domain-containing protein [Lentzea sp. CA-135723]|uniref:ATP-grasp domain-containing protein n=1 Tax=Lentzea sp. CA-135723 TaxID=3239950 RepID=UPI003D8C4C14